MIFSLRQRHSTQRQTDQGVDVGAHQYCIHQLEHGVFGLAQALIDSLAKLLKFRENHSGQ